MSTPKRDPNAPLPKPVRVEKDKESEAKTAEIIANDQRLERLKIQAQSVADKNKWGLRELPKAAGYPEQVNVRKPVRRGTRIKAEYIKGIGKTWLEAYEDLLFKLEVLPCE